MSTTYTSPSKFRSGLALVSLTILSLFSLGIFVVAVDLLWEARKHSFIWIAGPAPKDLDEKAKRLEEKVEAYNKRAGDLQTLASLLVGFSAIYTVVLGFNAYFGIQRSLQQAKDSADDLEKMRTEARQELDGVRAKAVNEAREVVFEIKREFPMFGQMAASMDRIMRDLMSLLPRLDWSEELYLNLIEKQKQEILFYEKTVASFEFFDLRHLRRTASEIYHGLGNFYGLKYKYDKKQNTQVLGDLDRSRFYLERAIREDDTNTAALNDRAMFAMELESYLDLRTAREFLESSLRIDARQQRARYNLAVVEHIEKNYAASEKLLTESLAQDRWQEEPYPQRLPNIYYNRACARVRLAEADPSRKDEHLKGALEDLKEFFSRKQLWDKTVSNTLSEDQKLGGDLYLLLTTPPFGQEFLTLLTQRNP